MTTPLKNAPTENETADHKVVYGEGPHAFTDRTHEMPVKYAKVGVASEKEVPATTIPHIFAEAAKKHGDKPALRVERPLPELVGKTWPPAQPLAQWKTWTWSQYYKDTRTAARAFRHLGLERFDSVNIFGFNSPEWILSEVACIFAGGIAAGIYPTDTPDQVAFKSTHSGGVIAAVESEKQRDIFLKAAKEGKLPKLKAIVVWAPKVTDGKSFEKSVEEVEVDGKKQSVTTLTWDDMMALGASDECTCSEEDLDKCIEEQKPGHCSAYIYTSGTTGNPKAVMITHDNILFESACVLTLMGKIGHTAEEERIVSYLPLSHVAGMMVDIICPIVVSAKLPAWVSVNFARVYDLKVGSLGDRLRCVLPTLFLGVPRVWEKIAEKMQKKGAETQGFAKTVATFAKEKGIERARNTELGGTGEHPWFYMLADMLVLSKVKDALGLNKCKFGFTGAAPITTDTLEYFGSLGVLINEVYGMSECTGATTWSTDEAHVWGSCGWTMPGTEVKIFRVDPDDLNKKTECPRANDGKHPTEDEQGEICFRGRHIMMGYMANPDLGEEHVAEITKKTNGAVDKDGWLHSGDKGCMDKRGMVKITGRYKELIIGAGGENIAPVPLEDNLKKICPAISNAMMVGDKRKFNVCLITLKTVGATGEKPGSDDLEGPALLLDPSCTTLTAAMDNEKVWKAVEKAIMDTNKNGEVCPSNASKIQKFTILPADFSVETEELTPTLKLKRSVVEKKYHNMIDEIYNCKENYCRYVAAKN